MSVKGAQLIAKARATIGWTKYETDIAAGHHALKADEHPVLGGKDIGPAPFEYLLSGLGACTAITLRMYADRKEWPLEAIAVDLRYLRDGDTPRIERTISLTGSLTEEQRARIAEIAEKTPVTLAIKGGVGIRTELR